MINLSTNYMGLTLRNPIIAGSSGLTNSVESLKELEANGIGAVVLKSLFEEQIKMEIDKNMSNNHFHSHAEMDDYLAYFEKKHIVDNYLKLIKDAKAELTIPVIASVNCISDSEWTDFAKDIEEAGADAIELNIFNIPGDPNLEDSEIEKTYYNIIKKVKAVVKIPVAVKIGYYFTNIVRFAKRLSNSNIDALVLFNRSNNPDINLNTLEMTTASPYTSKEQLGMSLRWTGLCSKHVNCSLAATTGIHDGEGVIKQILSGADAVQIASVLYLKSPAIVKEMLSDMETWMKEKDYESIADFKGKVAANSENNQYFERVQFIKYFSNHQ